MKQKLLGILILLSSFGVNAQTKVLFLGNSYTAVNNLPEMVRQMALGNGDTIIVDSYTPGGKTLQGHASDSISMAKLRESSDFLVLQAQSQEPSFPDAQFMTETYPYSVVLCDTFYKYNPCSKVVFYLTWGKKYGDDANCASFPPLCTFDGVTERLRHGYKIMADSNKALIAPVGLVWQKLWHADTTENFWQADNSHPSLSGSYIAATTIYSVIARESMSGNTYHAGLASITANRIQNVGWLIVRDSMETWNWDVYDRYLPHLVGFTAYHHATDEGMIPPVWEGEWDWIAVVKNDSVPDDSTWFHLVIDRDFNPSDTFGILLDTIIDVTHWGSNDSIRILTENTCFYNLYVTQYTISCGITDSISIVQHDVCEGIEEIPESALQFYPNPVKDKLFVSINNGTEDEISIALFNVMGQKHQAFTLKKGENELLVDMSAYSAGVYVFQITKGNQIFFKKLVKD